jgi:Bacteriophage HK97-gp10, putative tail-component
MGRDLTVPTIQAKLDTAAINKFADGVRSRLQAFFTEFSQDLSAEISAATPVKTGFLRSSWHVTINGEPAASIETLKIGDTFGYVNTAVYARRVEYGFVGTDSLGRHYNQPPRAFVRDTVARADVIAAETIARIK